MSLDPPTPPLPSVEEMRYQALYALLLEIRDGITHSNQFLDFIARTLATELDQTTGEQPAPES
jgi:hypothetical protein